MELTELGHCNTGNCSGYNSSTYSTTADSKPFQDKQYQLQIPTYGEGVLNNKEKLNTFLATVEQKAYRIAQIATHNNEDALEIVQDTMLKLVQYYSQKCEAEWRPLFFKILNNRITDFYRRNSITGKLMSWLGIYDHDSASYCNDMDLAEANCELKPDNLLEQQIDCAKVIAAMKKLSARQQQAFMLRAWQGLSVEETAYAMDCTAGSVKTHYSRAVHTLRDLLGGSLNIEEAKHIQ